MQTQEFYTSKEFDNGHYLVEVKTNTEGGLMVDIFFKHISGDWEFEDALLVNLEDIVIEDEKVHRHWDELQQEWRGE